MVFRGFEFKITVTARMPVAIFWISGIQGAGASVLSNTFFCEPPHLFHIPCHFTPLRTCGATTPIPQSLKMVKVVWKIWYSKNLLYQEDYWNRRHRSSSDDPSKLWIPTPHRGQTLHGRSERYVFRVCLGFLFSVLGLLGVYTKFVFRSRSRRESRRTVAKFVIVASSTNDLQRDGSNR